MSKRKGISEKGTLNKGPNSYKHTKKCKSKNSNNHSKNKEGVSRRTGDPQKQIQVKRNCQIYSKKIMLTLAGKQRAINICPFHTEMT